MDLYNLEGAYKAEQYKSLIKESLAQQKILSRKKSMKNMSEKKEPFWKRRSKGGAGNDSISL